MQRPYEKQTSIMTSASGPAMPDRAGLRAATGGSPGAAAEGTAKVEVEVIGKERFAVASPLVQKSYQRLQRFLNLVCNMLEMRLERAVKAHRFLRPFLLVRRGVAFEMVAQVA